MTTFTIDEQNSITAFASAEEAAAATTTPFDSFSSREQLAELAAGWPTERVLAIWNSLPGVTPAKGVKSAEAAIKRIWERIQSLATPDAPEPKPEQKAKRGDKAAKGAPAKGKATKKTTPAKEAPKARKAAKPGKPESGVRPGSKTEKVLDLLRRPNGATLKELMKATGWLAHSLRGFLSGTIRKKMGLEINSVKEKDGERTYSMKG